MVIIIITFFFSPHVDNNHQSLRERAAALECLHALRGFYFLPLKAFSPRGKTKPVDARVNWKYEKPKIRNSHLTKTNFAAAFDSPQRALVRHHATRRPTESLLSVSKRHYLNPKIKKKRRKPFFFLLFIRLFFRFTPPLCYLIVVALVTVPFNNSVRTKNEKKVFCSRAPRCSAPVQAVALGLSSFFFFHSPSNVSFS